MGENHSKISKSSRLGSKPPEQSLEDIRRLRLQKLEANQSEQHWEVDQKAFMYIDANRSSQSDPPNKPELQYAPPIEYAPAFQIMSSEPLQASFNQQNAHTLVTPEQSPLITTSKSIGAGIIYPDCPSHSNKEHLIHSLFEDIYQFTFETTSLQKKPQLKLLSNLTDSEYQKLAVFNFENVDDVIVKVLQSRVYYTDSQKLTLLYDIYNRLENINSAGLLDSTKMKDIKETIVSYMISYLTSPDIFNRIDVKEDYQNINDISCPLYNQLYSHLVCHDSNSFISDLITTLDETNLAIVLSPVFKRIIQNCNRSNVTKFDKLSSGINLLEALLYSDKRVIEFFVNSNFHIPTNPNINGLDLQKSTVFGACLSLTSFVDECEAVLSFFTDHNSLGRPEPILNKIRGIINMPINNLQRIIEYIIKVDQKYKKHIIDWIYNVLAVNDTTKKASNTENRTSEKGWFTNFILLLLKLCQRFLEDTNRYPAWFDKIDITYIQEKKIWDGILMLNNKSNVCLQFANSEETKTGGEDDEKPQKPVSKYSFITELVFLATHALLLQRSTNKIYIDFTTKNYQTYLRSGVKSPEYVQSYKKLLGYKVQLIDPYLLSQILKLLTFESLLIIHTFGVQVNNLDDICQVFEQTKNIKGEYFTEQVCLPVYWAENIQDLLLYFYQANPSTLVNSYQNFEILMDFVLSLLSNKDWIPDRNIKFKLLRLFASLIFNNHTEAQPKNEEFSFLFKQNPYFEKHLVSILLEMFIEVEKMTAKSSTDNKYNFRRLICQIITHFIKNESIYDTDSFIVEKLNKLSLNNQLTFTKAYISEIRAVIDAIIGTIYLTKAYNENVVSSDFAKLTPQERLQHTLNNNNFNKCVIPLMFDCLTDYFGMGASVSKVCPNFFFAKNLDNGFIVDMNYAIQQLINPEAYILKSGRMKEFNFDYKSFVENISRMYLNFSDREDFIVGVVSDKTGFNIKLFYKMYELIAGYPLLSVPEREQFAQLMENLEKKFKEIA